MGIRSIHALLGTAAFLLLPTQMARCETVPLRLTLPWEQPMAEQRAGAGGIALRDGYRLQMPDTFLCPVEPPVPEPAVSPPRRVVRASELRWLALGTALLVPTDRYTVDLFDPDIHRQSPGDEEGKSISKLGTGVPLLGAVLLPAMVDGRYGRKTTGLAGMAVLNATLQTEGIKFLVGRERPFESDGLSRFHGPKSGFDSFPSGHTAASFAAAEVLGHRYPKLKLPLYLVAGAVGWGRISAARHFPSDVFVGAAIGIYNGRLVLRRGGKLHVWR